MGQTLNVGGMTIEIDDEEDSPNVVAKVVPLTRTAPFQGKGSGRSRLHAVCPLHGASASGEPCDKFSSLPGNGRGIKQPNPFLRLVVIARILIKPVLIIGLIFGAYSAGQHLIDGGIFSAIIPDASIGGIPASGNAPDGTGIPAPDSTPVSPAIKSDCFQPGNPCGLVLPSVSVGK